MDGDGEIGKLGSSVPSCRAQAAEARAKLKAKLIALRDAMLSGLVDRDEPVRLLLAAMLAGEHMLLVGPPGTAKSELARRLHGIVGGAYFERLLTRFTLPEELFGPLSLRELENDRYCRRVEGYLPSASVAFIDEVFKANSAILNSLLTVLNERLFDNGAAREPIPLVSLIGASTELPAGDELSALYDRFLVRYQVGPVPPYRFAEMALAADLPWATPPEHERLTAADLDTIREGARSTAIAPDVVELLRGLRAAAPGLGLVVSDRRWKKIVKLLRTVAFIDARDEVSRWDFWVVPHCVWTTPEQRPAVHEWYEARLGVDESVWPERRPYEIEPMRYVLNKKRGERVDDCVLLDCGSLLDLKPQDCIAYLAHGRHVVDACLRDIGKRAREVDELLASHVVVPPAFRTRALALVQSAKASLERDSAELKALEDGFRRLPVRAERADP